MRILVTGASGFLGRHLVAHLTKRGDEVIALGVEPAQFEAGVRFVAADVRDRAQVREAIAAVEPERIVHLAALSHVGDSWKRMADYFEVNVLGTENVAAEKGNARLLFASTAEVYGQVPDDEQPIDERRAPAPRSPYALTKAAAERLAVAAGATVVRLFNLVGPGQAPTFALPSFAAQLAAIELGTAPAVLRVGNLAARRDFVPVADAVAGVSLLIDRGEPGAVANLASGKAITISEALELLRAVSGVNVQVKIDPERFRPVDVPLLAGSCRTLAGLGWRVGHTLEAALEEVWQEARRAARSR